MRIDVVNIQAAIHGPPALLQAIPFEAIAAQVWQARHTETWYPNKSDLNAFSFVPDQFNEAPSTLTAKWLADGLPMEMDFLEAIARACPDLEIAVIACVEYTDGGPEWNAYYSPAGSNTLLGQDGPFEYFGNQVTPGALSITDVQGNTHRFTVEKLARELAQGTEEPFAEEDYVCMLNSDLSISDFPGIQFHIRHAPQGVWSVIANSEEEPEKFGYDLLGLYEAEEWEVLLGMIFPDVDLRIEAPGYHFLDEEGNEYFLGWDWEFSASRADWGFPEDADWIPFDLEKDFDFSSGDEDDDEEEDY